MPLRYKKFILIFTLAVMFIGLGTFSLMAPDLNFSLSATKSDEQNIADAIKGKSDKDIKEEITDLVKEYFDARQKVDMDALADCVTDVDNIDERKLVAAAEYIENMRIFPARSRKAMKQEVIVFTPIMKINYMILIQRFHRLRHYTSRCSRMEDLCCILGPCPAKSRRRLKSWMPAKTSRRCRIRLIRN